MKETPGKIFLAEQRGILETPQYVRFSTFNFKGFYQEHKQPIGNLYLVNEEILAGSQSLGINVEQDSHFIIIPLVGAVQIYFTEDKLKKVDVGEVQVIAIPPKTAIHLINPFKADTIHFLLLGIKADQPVNSVRQQIFCYDFKDLENQLATILQTQNTNKDLTDLPFSLNLGRFDGRREALYYLQDKKSICFTFVLAGAFEVEGRLLHEKDGLALWDTVEVEIEALSNNALLIMVELNQTK